MKLSGAGVKLLLRSQRAVFADSPTRFCRWPEDQCVVLKPFRSTQAALKTLRLCLMYLKDDNNDNMSFSRWHSKTSEENLPLCEALQISFIIRCLKEDYRGEDIALIGTPECQEYFTFT